MDEVIEIQKRLSLNYDYIIQDVPVLFKYFDFSGGFKSLVDLTLKIKHPSIFNDPYDCYDGLIDFNNIYDIVIDDYLKLIPNEEIKGKKISKEKVDKFKIDSINSTISKIGVSCFCEENDNLLMWSHYADSHKGICIGYNLDKLYSFLKKKHIDLILYKIHYTNKLQKIDILKYSNEALINWLSTKSKVWNYENEIRFIFYDIFNNSSKNIFLPLDINIIDSIYLGSKIKPEDFDSIMKLMKNKFHQIKIFRMNLKSNVFELLPQNIDLNNL